MKRRAKIPFPSLFILSLALFVGLFALILWRARIYTVTHEALITASLDMMGLLVLSVFLMGCYAEPPYQPLTNRAFRYFLFSVVLLCFFDGIGAMLDRIDAPLFIGGSILSRSLCIFLYAANIIGFARFLSRFLPALRPKWLRTYLRVCSCYLLVLALALIANVQFGFFFRVEHGVMFRRPLLFVQSAINYVFLLIILVDLMHKKMDREEKWGVLSFTAIPLVVAIVQYRFLRLSLLAASTCVSACIIYVHAHNRRSRLILEQRAEQEQQQTALMLSQIQPHFLYNSLNAIVALCDIDPQLAKQTTLNFSTYLERNLENLTEREPIPFERELDHVDAYLQIEQVRFGELLKVEYEIGTTDFRIPSLTLQPLVENAVKHGLHKKPEGGTVTIASEAVPDGWLVTVSDDGVGFDPKAVVVHGHGIGIRNIRQRLHSQSGGTLTITSTPGMGTKAVIFIPKEDDT